MISVNYAECCIIRSVVKLNVAMLSVSMPNTESHFAEFHGAVSFMVQAPAADLNKLFLRKLTHSLCKLDIYIATQQILLTFMKWPSLQKVWVNLCQLFMRLTPIKNFQL